MKTKIRSNWSHAILVCRKCSKKNAKRGASFGPKGKPLAKALKKELGAKKGRKSGVGVVEVSCLGVCPARGVVVVDSRSPGHWQIVLSDADIGDLARQLAGTSE
ncbi:(2Fe-2S) ferredoxin domain-containing protein [Croceicoccus gelatinilyticus]|uniref:(2Fe-2S) ferredoxin domain-containing protein n=1 Tax=Croceicoccus gelatinilyticus TaxID=2835536 RepID=UPI001BD0FA09|nr:(2Fe-2S) ferredoxin domain-containing protein [Croceicoccus gelatinilyticus]MBS7668851.1 (2Fe-2S) ferredoxin domain-containing protein [Croceicoccus gelatinilyticus]